MWRAPVNGSAVNRMPDTSGSTMRCTTTDRLTWRWSKLFWMRYKIARSVKSETQQSRTAVNKACSPRTFR